MDGIVLDGLLALVMLLLGFILRRIFSITDSLRAEDRKLLERISQVQTEYLSKVDFERAVTRIIDSITRLEAKIDK
tara:strand:- start:142 stop:369 length:228 start_codon:yes stop_codon:yes gene_type:complete